MMKCNKCGNQPQETDKFGWKCTSCGKMYGAKLSYLRAVHKKKKSVNTSLVKCKECGDSLDNGKEKIVWKCSCGNMQVGKLEDYAEKVNNAIKGNLIKCPECNEEIDGNVSACPCCGFPIKQKEIIQEKTSNSIQETDTKKQKKKTIIGIIMCIVGCICFIFAITRVTNEKYKFYTENYGTYVAGYEENLANANEHSWWLLKDGYDYIASSYKDMADDSKKEIWKYRCTAIVSCVIGICFVFVGYKNIRKRGSDV